MRPSPARRQWRTGEKIPEPSTLDTLAKDQAMKGAAALLVNVDIAENAVRFNITARKSQMQEISRRARKKGVKENRPARTRR